MRVLAALIVILTLASTCFAQEVKNRIPNTIGSLTACVSTQPGDLKEEAQNLDIPKDQTMRYVTEMRDLNRGYQAGAITRTEYVAAKREIIQRLR